MTNTAWEVVYTDKTTLKQYNDNKENTFNDIDLNRLFEFRIYHNNKILSLFMPSGTFGINGFLYDTDVSWIKDNIYKLIYFSRVKKVLGNGKDTKTYFIGFQINIDGISHKRMISICDNQINFIN